MKHYEDDSSRKEGYMIEKVLLKDWAEEVNVTSGASYGDLLLAFKKINELVDAVNKLEQKNSCEIETCDHTWGTIGNSSEETVCLKCGKVGTGESIYNSEDINYSEKPNSSKEK